MATKVYSSSYISSALGLNTTPYISVSGSGSAEDIINSVVVSAFMSTTLYSISYSVRCRVYYSGGYTEKTQTVSFNSDNYTGATFTFTMPSMTVAQANSITAIDLYCDDSRIFVKHTQYVTVSYTVASACGEPQTVSISSTLVESDPTLSWSGAAAGDGNSITGYEIQYAESTDGSTYGSWTALKTVSSTATSGSTTVTKPSARGYYRKYRIRTQGSLGSDYYSTWVETSAARYNSVPEAPATVTVAPATYESGGVTVSWSASSDVDNNVTRYELQRSASSDGVSWGAWDDVNTELSGLSYVDSPTVTRGEYIKYRVRAVDSLGVASGYTESSAVQRNQLPPAPTIDYPQASQIIYNARPRVLITLGTEPDGQVQAITATGYVVSSSGPYNSGKKLILRKTSSAAAGTVSPSVTSQDSQGAVSSAATVDLTYAAASFTDDMNAGVTRVKAAHINELRGYIDTIRAYYGLSAYAWSETITANQTSLSGWNGHILELWEAVDEVVALVNGWDTSAISNQIVLDTRIVASGKQPHADIMQQLRAAIALL